MIRHGATLLPHALFVILRRQESQYFGLDWVHILKLVDEHMCEPPLEIRAQSRLRSQRACNVEQ